MTTTAYYEFFEHTADVGLDAWGPTLNDAFAQAAYGVMAIITDDNEVKPEQSFRFDVTSIDREGLLVQFLTQLLILHETKNVVLTDFDITLHDHTRASVTCRGEQFDEAKHGGGVHVKAVSYHMMQIDDATGDTPAHLKVLFDI